MWSGLMKDISSKPNCAGHEPRFKHVEKNNEAMDEIQRQLEEYLEEKRGKFPRFYFLSNDELLQILAVSTDMTKVEKHLMKVFQAIHSLQFSETKQILAMISPEQEKVKFKNTIRTKGNSDSKIEDTL